MILEESRSDNEVEAMRDRLETEAPPDEDSFARGFYCGKQMALLWVLGGPDMLGHHDYCDFQYVMARWQAENPQDVEVEEEVEAY